MTIDPSYVPIIVALLGAGGVLTKILDVTLDRWRLVSGRKRSHAEEIARWRESLARARFMLSERGVPEDQLPDYPE